MKIINLRSGFTLVELAIVMIIIGLLIGGLLKGQELIVSSRVAATVAHVKEIETATNAFRDKYAGMPGDIPNANARITGCAGACVAPAGPALGNARVDSNATGFAAAPANEHVAYWIQLATSDLMTGIDAAQGPIWGGQFPEAKVGGGFHIAFVDAVADLPGVAPAVAGVFSSGHYLAIQFDPAGPMDNIGSITPNQYYRLDSKLDDGLPIAGEVFSSDVGGRGCLNAAGALQELVDARVCNLYVRILQ